MDRREERELAALRHSGLHRHRAAGRQAIFDQRVELAGEQHARRPFLERLDQIDRDEVEALLALLQIGARVLVPELGARVVERALVQLGQVRLAKLDHLAVDVHHDGTRDRGVSKNLPEGGAFTAADHQGALGSRLRGQEAGMDQCLVIDELVALARLNASIENQDFTVAGSLKYLDVLKLGLGLHDRLGDGMHMAFERGRSLEKPLIGLRIDQLTWTGALLTIGTEEFMNMPRCISTLEVRYTANCSTIEVRSAANCSTR